LGAIMAATAAGLSIPEDLSVASFGNEGAILAQGFGKRLTTVGVDFRQMGRLAARLLLKKIQTPARPPEAVRVETHLLPGETTSKA
jgi:DNA-binding LacI/PurR family transcriptional regulator